jgi:6-phosphofructokinase 1
VVLRGGHGRTAGHLALGIAKAAGATLAVIAEEFAADRPLPLEHLVDLLECSMFKRIAHGRPFGVAILAEGLGLRLSPEELEKAMPDVERDEHGHIRLAELELHTLLAQMVKERFRARGKKVTIEAKNIGYELRSAPPIPFDIEYTRDLGFGAFDYLRRLVEEGREELGAMVALHEANIIPLPFGSFTDPLTGRPQVREVDIDSASYRVATEYMIRLKPDDLEDAEKLEAIAEAAEMPPDAFRSRYGYLVAARA